MRKLRRTLGILLSAGAAILCIGAKPASAQTAYTVALNDGNEGTWNTVYAQGFNTSLGANPVPGASNGDTVDLTQFQFFKSGTADSASNIQLAIFNTMYPNTTGLTTVSPAFVGLSTTILGSTSALNTGDAETFAFANLPLVYGTDYSAYFVNVGAGGTLTPVLVSALTVNYYPTLPQSNYGTTSQYQYVTGNTISGGYLQAFADAGDARFSASLTTVPEPASLGMLSVAALAFLKRRSR